MALVANIGTYYTCEYCIVFFVLRLLQIIVNRKKGHDITQWHNFLYQSYEYFQFIQVLSSHIMRKNIEKCVKRLRYKSFFPSRASFGVYWSMFMMGFEMCYTFIGSVVWGYPGLKWGKTGDIRKKMKSCRILQFERHLNNFFSRSTNSKLMRPRKVPDYQPVAPQIS